MAKTVENKDIFGGDLFKGDVIKDGQAFLKLLDDIEMKFKDVAKSRQEALNKEDQKTIQSVQRTRTAIKELNDVERVASKLNADKIRLNDRLVALRTKQGKQNEELKLQIREQTRLTKQLVNENKSIVGSYKAISNRLNRLRGEYKDLAASEKGNTKEAKILRKEIQKLDRQLKGIDKTVGQSQRNVGNYQSAWSGLGRTLRSGLGFLGLTSGVALIGGAISDARQTVVEFDESVADLRKVTGLAEEDARSLADSLLRIDTRTGVQSLLELATAGGRLGLEGRELIDFTEQVDRAFVSLGDSLDGSAEEIGLTLGKIAANFGVEEQFGIGEAINKVGSSLNELGANSKAQEGAIVDFTKRLSGVGNAAGLSVAEVQSLGALFDETGQSIEVAASTLNKLLPAIGKDTEKFARIAGKDIEEFERLVTEKPLEALKQVAQGAKNSQGGLIGLSKTLENYGVDSSRAAGIVNILSNETERLTELQEIANQGFEDGTSLADEFAVKMETAAAKSERLGNNWDKLVLSIENGSGPISEAFGSILDSLNDFIEGLILANKTYAELQAQVREEGISESVKEDVKEFRNFQKAIGRTDESGKELSATIERFLDVDKKRLRQLLTRFKAGEQLTRQEKEEAFLLDARIKAIRGLNKETKELNFTETESDSNKKKKAKRELTGLIEKQAEVVSKLNEQIQRATTEEQILELSLKFDVETEELERLRRIVSSTFEEIDKIERDLVDDSIERRIQQEIEKSEKLIQQIESNSRIETKKKEELIAKEEERLATFINRQEIKAGKQRIKNAEDLAKAEFEQRRTGFKNEVEFEEEKEAQFKAIRIKALQEEIALLEQFGDERDQVRIAQLNAEIESLRDFQKESEELYIDFLEVISDVIDEAFNKRIEAIGEQLEATGKRLDFLRDKAANTRLASEESLAFEQKKERELELERERQRKRQQRTQAFFTVLSSFQAAVRSGSPTPLQDTIRDIGVLKALASSFGSAFEGVDDTGGRGDWDGKGGKPWILHPNEQVYSKEDRKALGFRSREEVKDIVRMYDSGMLTDLMAHDVSNDFVNPSAFVLNGMMDTKQIVGKLDEVKNELKRLEPIQGSVTIDEVKKVINYTYKKGNRIVHEKAKLFGS